MLLDFPSVAGNMPNAAPGAATILDYSEMRRPSINNSCNKVIVIKLDKLYYSESKLFNLKHKLCNNNMPTFDPRPASKDHAPLSFLKSFPGTRRPKHE